MPANYFYPTSKNAIQKNLAAQLLSTATTGDAITFDDVDGIQNKPGVLVINRIDANNASTPSAREFISFTGTSGNTVLIDTRNVDGSGATRTHAIGSIVEFISDAVWAQRIIDQALVEHGTDGTHSVANMITGGSVLDEDTMSSNSATALATQQSIKAYVDTDGGSLGGWTKVTDTWVYASASTFTIAGVDRTTIFTPGTRLKFTQTTAKYAVVVSSSFSTNTTVTIAVNNDYTIANAAITLPYYSYQANPQGYPGWFNFTSAETWANPPTSRTTYCKYAVNGRTAFFRWGTIGTANGSNSGQTIILSLPIASITSGTTRTPIMGNGIMTDNISFTDYAVCYATSTGAVTFEFPIATRKPTIVNGSCSYEI